MKTELKSQVKYFHRLFFGANLRVQSDYLYKHVSSCDQSIVCFTPEFERKL